MTSKSHTPRPPPSGRRRFTAPLILLILAAGLICGWQKRSPRCVILGSDTRWGPGTIVIDHRVVVPHDAVLSIQPGTTVTFGHRAGLIVYGGLHAIGTCADPILFTRRPDTEALWGQVAIYGATQGARIAHTRFEYAGADAQVIDIRRSVVAIEAVRFADMACTVVQIVDSSLHLSHSTFEALGEYEFIRGKRIPEGGHMIVASNVFHTNVGYRDIIDFSLCARPGPVPRFVGNHFLGGGDDGLDLDYCDAYVAGNTFVNFNLRGHDKWANAISVGRNSRVHVTNNVFAFNDHGILTKDDSHVTVVHCTFYSNKIAAISFNEPAHTGGGATIERCVFAGNASAFKYGKDARVLTVTHSILPLQDDLTYTNNLAMDPPFVDAGAGDYRLEAGTPAWGANLPPPARIGGGS